MTQDYAIQAENLGKCYIRRGMGAPTLFGALTSGFRRKPDPFWCIRGATFGIPPGRTVGVIGPNGAGKSSLLGLVAGTIAPTEGSVSARGRISSLLELGAGFHPDLTGRENVYLNGALLGIPREDIRRKFDRIVDFAELREFIDMPVKHYSSGMYVRLGFSVAVEVDPDILLVDEVLAVGDIAFQLKCLDRIRDFQCRGKTLLFVSHALQTVEEFCHEAFLVHHGRLVERGDPPDVIQSFIRSYMGEGGGLYTQEFGTRAVEFGEVRLLDGEGRESAVFRTGGELTVEIPYVAHRRVEHPVFGFSLKTGNGQYVYGTNTQLAGRDVPAIEGEGKVRFSLGPLQLMRGNYFLSLAIHSWDHKEQFHRREDWWPFAVRNDTGEPGLFRLHAAWDVPPATDRTPPPP
ncbi:MAG: ABC transporter ATP-binding protein [Kiritimatiellae bacterium]|nr:ABC transporter ATP-binding protein [Kiritimatiellia bacterium]